MISIYGYLSLNIFNIYFFALVVHASALQHREFCMLIIIFSEQINRESSIITSRCSVTLNEGKRVGTNV